MLINIEKLNKSLEDRKGLSEDDLLVRELLEICYKNRNSINEKDLAKFNYRIFKKAYDEIMKVDYDDMLIIKDMARMEFLSENLDNIIPFDDDDDIY